MTDQTTQHRNIFAALAVAQSQMGDPRKTAMNDHFKKPYADLKDVVRACRPALSANGISYFFQHGSDERGDYLVATLYHGESATSLDSGPVRVMTQKSDAQGYKSGTTYAKRIALESVTGLAPGDDDDANEAVANEVRQAQAKASSWAATILAELPDDATDADKARALTDALVSQWGRMKGAQQLDNEWDRRAGIINRIKQVDVSMWEEVVDAFENRKNDIEDERRHNV